MIGAETFSKIMDWTDRGTCVLFGDGAGALVLEAKPAKARLLIAGFLATDLNSDGRHRDLLYVDGGVSTQARPGTCACRAIRCFATPSKNWPHRAQGDG